MENEPGSQTDRRLRYATYPGAHTPYTQVWRPPHSQRGWKVVGDDERWKVERSGKGVERERGKTEEGKKERGKKKGRERKKE